MKTLFHHVLNYTKYKRLDCALKRVLRTLMFSGKEDPTDWLNTYTSFNSDDPLPNLEPKNLIRILGLLTFRGEEDCAEIEPGGAFFVNILRGGEEVSAETLTRMFSSAYFVLLLVS